MNTKTVGRRQRIRANATRNRNLLKNLSPERLFRTILAKFGHYHEKELLVIFFLLSLQVLISDFSWLLADASF